MQRINTPDGQFHAGDPSTGTLGTMVTRDFMQSVQEELAAIPEGVGMALDPNDSKQVVKAIQKMIDAVKSLFAPIKSPVFVGDPVKAPGLQAAGKVFGVNSPNLLFNSSGEFGTTGWTASVGSGLDVGIDAAGGGSHFTNSVALAGSTWAYTSANIPAPPAGSQVTISLDGFAGGATAGSIYARFVFLDSNGGEFSWSPQQVAFAPGSSWANGTATATVPAAAVFMAAQIVADSGPQVSVNGIRFRRIKIEQGTSASLYSQEASIAPLPMPVVGSARNVSMAITSASTLATIKIDEVVVETALGGFGYRIAGFNKSINLATTGAGGMDVGAAPTSSYVAIYVIYKPSTGASALLATNCTSSIAPEVYSAGSMPAGYRASALVSVWPTDSSGRLIVGFQRDRNIAITSTPAITTSSNVGTQTQLSISGIVPMNAKNISGVLHAASTTSGSCTATITPGLGSVGGQNIAGALAANPVFECNYCIQILTPQSVYYTTSVSSGTPTFTIYISGYSI